MDLDKLGNVNARLVRAREAYHQALIAEHQMREPGVRNLSAPNDGRKTVRSTKERVRQTAEEYDEALAEFIKFTVARRSA